MDDLDSPLDNVQKKELSEAIEKLEGAKLEKVITIIQEGVPGIGNVRPSHLPPPPFTHPCHVELGRDRIGNRRPPLRRPSTSLQLRRPPLESHDESLERVQSPQTQRIRKHRSDGLAGDWRGEAEEHGRGG